MKKSLTLAVFAALCATPAMSQAGGCSFPDLSGEEVAAITASSGVYLGICWLGRIMIRMMT